MEFNIEYWEYIQLLKIKDISEFYRVIVTDIREYLPKLHDTITGCNICSGAKTILLKG
jgi:hypothetical protein